MRNHAVAPVLVVALAVLAYFNGLGGEFVLDDRPFLVDNPKLSEPHPFSYFFAEHVWAYSNLEDVTSTNYRPLHFLGLWQLNRLAPGSALALHSFSLLLHIGASLLLLRVIRRLMPGIPALIAGLAAGLFAVHPVHSEAVAWISAFIHPLVTVFLLSAWLLHDRAWRGVGRGGWPSALLALVCFGLGLLSHEVALAFPVFILLHDRIRYGRFRSAAIAPYLVLVAGYFVLRSALLGEAVPLVLGDPDMWLRFPIFVAEYLRHLLLPWPQPLYLHMPGDWAVSVTAIVVVIGCLAFGVWLTRTVRPERRVALVATAWIAASSLPLLAAAFSPSARFAVRSLYLPSAGIALLVAWLIHTLPPSRQALGIRVAALLVLAGLLGTVAANRHWADDGEVYGRIIASNPLDWAGYQGQGEYFARLGETDTALGLLEQAASLAEGEERAIPLERQALILGQAGETSRSLELYREVIELTPDAAPAWIGVGNNLWALGSLEEAAEAYRRALEVDPGRWKACSNLVMVLNQLGRPTEATRYAACARPPG